MKRRLSNSWVALSVILIVTAIIYSNIYKAPFIFDGVIQIENKTMIRDLKHYFSPRVLFMPRPLVEFTFALNYKFGKLNVFGYHLVNVAIHVINGFLVYFLALTIFKQLSALPDRIKLKGKSEKTKREEKTRKTQSERTQFLILDFPSSIQWMSLFTALIFVAHPIQIQAVTYTVQRYASMAAMFYFLSILCYVKARLIQQRAEDSCQLSVVSGQKAESRERRGEDGGQRAEDRHGIVGRNAFSFQPSVYFTFSFLCFVLAFLCKQNTASLPGAILLVEYLLFDRTWQGWKRKLLWLAPAFVLMGVFILYVSGLFRGGLQFGSLLEDVSDILRAPGTEISRWIYLCTQFNVVVIYIKLLFFPMGQNADWLYPFKSGFLDGYTPLAFLFLIAVIVVGIWNIKKRPVIAFGIFWFFMTLSVESSIFPIKDAMFEQRLYLPIFGFALVMAYLIFQPLSRIQTTAVVISFAIIVAFGTTTFFRNRVWQSDITLWSDVVSKNPLNHRGRNNLGNALGHRGRLKEGIRHYVEALRLKPDYANAHNNLGGALTRIGNFDRAIYHLIKALRMKPKLMDAYNNLGVAMVAKGRPQEAIRWLSEALAISPKFAGAHNSLGNVLAQEGRQEEAVWHWSEALRIKPDYAEAHYNLGIVQFQRGALNEAAKHFSGAIRGRPDYAEAYSKLGVTMTRQRDFDGAKRNFQKALEINPGLMEARRGLEMSLKLMRRRSN
jgi:tetratricopeptide (TPR) repeat protein